MENIDIIIVAGVSFLLVIGGLFIGMYLARRAEAARIARLDEREERLLRMRAKFEHERFALSAAESGEDVILDEDLFRGFKEEIEQERLELDMRREELELDLRMLEEENDRLKSRLGVGPNVNRNHDEKAEEATIVTESDLVQDVEDAVGIANVVDADDAVFVDAVESADDEDETTVVEEVDDTDDIPTAGTIEHAENSLAADTSEDAENLDDLPVARNTIFGVFNFEEDEESVEPSAEVDEPADDGWSSEPDPIETSSPPASLVRTIGGDGAAEGTMPEGTGPNGQTSRIRASRPAFDHILTSDEEKPADGSVQQVLGLSDSDLALMNDLGYGTFRSIADLTEEEIARLAETFDIPENRIRDEWIPDSRMRVAREPRA